MTHLLAQVVPFVIIIGLALAWLLSGLWAARDAVSRGKSGLLVSLLVLFLAWPLSIVLWIIVRPDDECPPFGLRPSGRQ